MFSGIIETIGTVQAIDLSETGKLFHFQTDLPLAEVRIGDSVAIDGCCLTVTGKTNGTFAAFVSHETLAKTTLKRMQSLTRVNLERSLQVGARLDGHWVQGHVETVGTLREKKPVGESLEIAVDLAAEFRPLVVSKGSIAVDGISLTLNRVADTAANAVRVWINLIPHTLEQTTLGSKTVGEGLNIETDILGRYAFRYLETVSKPIGSL